jgi:hypothetical protein
VKIFITQTKTFEYSQYPMKHHRLELIDLSLVLAPHLLFQIDLTYFRITYQSMTYIKIKIIDSYQNAAWHVISYAL